MPFFVHIDFAIVPAPVPLSVEGKGKGKGRGKEVVCRRQTS